MWYTKDAPVILNYYVTSILPVLNNTTTLVAGPCGPVRYGQLSYVPFEYTFLSSLDASSATPAITCRLKQS